MAAILEAMGDLPAAEAAYERALSMARSVNHRLLEAAALCNLGRVRATRDLDGARPLFEEAIAISRTIAYTENIINVLSAYGRAETRSGDPDHGRSLLIESLALAASTSAHGSPSVGQVLRTLAAIEHRRGDPSMAAVLLGRARALDPEPERDAFDDGIDLHALLESELGDDLDAAMAGWEGLSLGAIAQALQERLVEPVTG